MVTRRVERVAGEQKVLTEIFRRHTKTHGFVVRRRTVHVVEKESHVRWSLKISDLRVRNLRMMGISKGNIERLDTNGVVGVRHWQIRRNSSAI